ncbi:MAG: acetylglutamate kinase [Acidobacteriota bacterium]
MVLKLGGELLEPDHLPAMARLVARVSRAVRLVVVHGGGREIDAALAQAGIPKRQVDGLRVTDEATLLVVIAVLAGAINTRFVAAINAAGGRAVGLTGADAGVGLVRPAPKHRASSGELVDLGLVGEPIPGRAAPLVSTLTRDRFVPVIACVGASRNGRLFNVNADMLAGSLAIRLSASRLVVAGATAGVLDQAARTISTLDAAAVDALISSGTATAGMIAKLRACRNAAGRPAREVVIADGRKPAALGALLEGAPLSRRAGPWTTITNASGH